MKKNYLFVFIIFMAIILSHQSLAQIIDEEDFDCGIEPIQLEHGRRYTIKQAGTCADQRGLAAPRFSVKLGCDYSNLGQGEKCIKVKIIPLDSTTTFSRNYSYKYRIWEISDPFLFPLYDILVISFNPGPGHCDLEGGTRLPNDCGFFGSLD